MILIIMTSENILKTKNEIVDLRDIIFVIWRKKFIFLIVTIFFLILGFLYNFIYPPVYKIEIDINRIPFSNLTHYSNLNLSVEKLINLPLIIKEEEREKLLVTIQESQRKKDIDEGKFISRDKLLYYFVEKFNNREIITNAIISSNYINKDNLSEEEYNQLLNSLTYNFSINPIFDLKNEIVKYVVSFSSTNTAKSIELVSIVFDEINNEIKNTLINEFDSISINMKKYKEQMLEDLEFEKVNLLENYDDGTTKRIAFLTEQAKIARSLGIAENDIAKEDLYKNEELYYLRGFEAIESELTFLKERKDRENYVADLTEIQSRKRILQNSQIIDRSREAIIESPLYNEVFKSVSYDVNLAVISESVLKKYSILLSFFVGIIVSLISILLIDIIRSKESESN